MSPERRDARLGRTCHELGLDDKAREGAPAPLKTFDPKISGQLQREMEFAAVAPAPINKATPSEGTSPQPVDFQ